MTLFKRTQLIVAGTAILGLGWASSASAQCYSRRVSRTVRTVYSPAISGGFAPVAALPTPIYAGRTVVVEQPVVAYRPRYRTRSRCSSGFGFSFSFGRSHGYYGKHYKRSRHHAKRSFGFTNGYRDYGRSFSFSRSHHGYNRSFSYKRSYPRSRGHCGYGRVGWSRCRRR